MADLRNKTKNQLKRKVSVFVAEGLTEAQLLDAPCTLFNLPLNSLITKVEVYISTVSTTGSSTLDLAVGGVVLANEVPVTVAGAAVVPTLTAVRKYPTGGAVTIAGGATPPAADDLVFDIVVEYVEYDLTCNTYAE